MSVLIEWYIYVKCKNPVLREVAIPFQLLILKPKITEDKSVLIVRNIS